MSPYRLYLGQPIRLTDDPKGIVYDRIYETFTNTAVLVAQVPPDQWLAYRTVRNRAAQAKS